MIENKIVIFFYTYNLGSYSGAAFQALNLAIHMERPITIFNIGSPLYEKLPNHLKIVNLPSALLPKLLIIFSHLLRGKVKVIHFHGQFLLPMAAARILRIPYILKTTLMGDDDFHSLQHKRFGRIRLWLSSRCAINIVLSNQLKEINSTYISTEKVQLIPNGVIVPNSFGKLKTKLNHFYFCGVISKRKNTLKAIEIFEKNYAHLSDSRLFIIGPDRPYGIGREIDFAYIEKCKTYIEKKGLINKVIFTGLLSQLQVSEITKQCKALLFFSEAEGMPNVVLEAMASNCVPIISSMHGVGNELVAGGAGFVCEDKVPSIDVIDHCIEIASPYYRAKNFYSFSTVKVSIDALYRKIFSSN